MNGKKITILALSLSSMPFAIDAMDRKSRTSFFGSFFGQTKTTESPIAKKPQTNNNNDTTYQAIKGGNVVEPSSPKSPKVRITIKSSPPQVPYDKLGDPKRRSTRPNFSSSNLDQNQSIYIYTPVKQSKQSKYQNPQGFIKQEEIVYMNQQRMPVHMDQPVENPVYENIANTEEKALTLINSADKDLLLHFSNPHLFSKQLKISAKDSLEISLPGNQKGYQTLGHWQLSLTTQENPSEVIASEKLNLNDRDSYYLEIKQVHNTFSINLY